MARHGNQTQPPAELEPGTQRVISVRMDYIPPGTANAWGVIGRRLKRAMWRAMHWVAITTS
jgi:epoxyqueuosine reductase QueG